MKEIWQNINIEEYEKYEVSNLGRIKNKKGQIMKPKRRKDGYLSIRLYKKGKCKEFKIHRLVMISFVKNVDKSLDINHIDGNKTNNRLDNLEWCTHKYNMQHAIKTGLFKNRKPISKQKTIIEQQTKKANKISRIEYNRMTEEERIENIRNIINTKMRVVNESISTIKYKSN